VANRLLKRIRDFAQVEGSGVIDRDLARMALQRLGVDAVGLDDLDRRILTAIADKFDGGPVGLTNLAAAIGEEADTIETVYEPFLIQEGLLQRTPRGRMLTRGGWEHLGHVPPQSSAGQGAPASETEQKELF
jgi:Holliday junction DNA helicase RuvB